MICRGMRAFGSGTSPGYGTILLEQPPCCRTVSWLDMDLRLEGPKMTDNTAYIGMPWGYYAVLVVYDKANSKITNFRMASNQVMFSPVRIDTPDQNAGFYAPFPQFCMSELRELHGTFKSPTDFLDAYENNWWVSAFKGPPTPFRVAGRTCRSWADWQEVTLEDESAAMNMRPRTDDYICVNDFLHNLMTTHLGHYPSYNDFRPGEIARDDIQAALLEQTNKLGWVR